MSIYFDNAATTPLGTAVLKSITPGLLNYFGNSSSRHQQGREVKKAIKNSRKTTAKLEQLLQENPRSIVAVTNANNQIKNLNDIEQIILLSERYNGLVYIDKVQPIEHYHINLQKLETHFLTASAHKFQGSKSTGLLYCGKELKLKFSFCLAG